MTTVPAVEANLHQRIKELDELNTKLQQTVIDLTREIEQLRERLAFNAVILAAAGEGILGVDIAGNTTFANPAALHMLGLAAEELLHKPQHALIHHTKPDGTPYPREECPVYAAFRNGIPQRVDSDVFWRKDGTQFPVEYLSAPLHHDGVLVGAVVVFTDITERKRAEARHRQALLQEEFVRMQAAMLRELATPLIPVSDEIVVMPLIGAIDSVRAQQLLETLLVGITTQRARMAIVDITGVPVVDNRIAQALINAMQAVQLLGAQAVITGIRPEVAHILVGLGLSLDGIITHATLQSGIAYGLRLYHEQRS